MATKLGLQLNGSAKRLEPSSPLTESSHTLAVADFDESAIFSGGRAERDGRPDACGGPKALSGTQHEGARPPPGNRANTVTVIFRAPGFDCIARGLSGRNEVGDTAASGYKQSAHLT